MYEFAQGQRENQRRGNNEEGINGRYQDLIAAQRENQQRGNNDEGINDVYEPLRYNREDNNDGCDSPAVQRDNQQISHGIKIDKKINTDTQGPNCDIVDNQKRENLSGQRSAAGYEDMSQAQRFSMPQETSSGPVESLNIPGSEQRESRNEKDCDIQQLEEANEDTGASQTLAISQATGRQPVENDDDVLGALSNSVQCTDVEIKATGHL